MGFCVVAVVGRDLLWIEVGIDFLSYSWWCEAQNLNSEIGNFPNQSLIQIDSDKFVADAYVLCRGSQTQIDLGAAWGLKKGLTGHIDKVKKNWSLSLKKNILFKKSHNCLLFLKNLNLFWCLRAALDPLVGHVFETPALYASSCFGNHKLIVHSLSIVSRGLTHKQKGLTVKHQKLLFCGY